MFEMKTCRDSFPSEIYRILVLIHNFHRDFIDEFRLHRQINYVSRDFNNLVADW